MTFSSHLLSLRACSWYRQRVIGPRLGTTIIFCSLPKRICGLRCTGMAPTGHLCRLLRLLSADTSLLQPLLHDPLQADLRTALHWDGTNWTPVPPAPAAGPDAAASDGDGAISGSDGGQRSAPPRHRRSDKQSEAPQPYQVLEPLHQFCEVRPAHEVCAMRELAADAACVQSRQTAFCVQL